ncbi:class I SAM-dependent methyltransferase [Flavobacterium pallidum]|uniref:Class I SAM-dependent methyltransferase n=1 Tax=Flavobacterium pallidum TaxID=2172098 RepID=A0A2S1SF96_9FLAO|nr:class I SAM-dependent methyltransferase [Flavobacterium pallidum]AWI25017.1 class I SAM-dependent methyltransferase [Flavobacterium pallidum]
MTKAQFSGLLRKTGLIMLMDRLRFSLMWLKKYRHNADFRKRNPNVRLPPDYLIYESFQMNYEKYYTGSIKSAQNVANCIGRHIELSNVNILDWGCGPGRVIRQLPDIVGPGCRFYGTDYNGKTIAWCKENLPGIDFNHNTIEASLPYPDEFFDVIYGISIFTHLSEKMHDDWYRELSRVLKVNGVMYLTTQGDNFRLKLTPQELQRFDKGELVVRGSVTEGHRMFSAFQPKAFMRKLFNDNTILEHIVTDPQPDWIPQDEWLLLKSAKA